MTVSYFASFARLRRDASFARLRRDEPTIAEAP